MDDILKPLSEFFTFIFSGKFFVSFGIFLLSSSVSMFVFVLDLIPDLPNLPDNVYQNVLSFFDFPFTSGAIGFIGWIFGNWTMFSLVVFIALSIFSTRIIYDLWIFIITKLPLGVKR